jgi:hypothetical protein
MKQKATAGDKGFAKHYYDDLGNYQMSYSIRLTEEDDELMEEMGWKFMLSHIIGTPAAYYNTQGYRALFYNRAVDTSKPVCDIFKPDVGGKIHIQLSGTGLENPHKVVQYLLQHPGVVSNSESEKKQEKQPVSLEEIQKAMDSIGFKSHAIDGSGGHMFKSLSGYRIITVQPADGSVAYSFQYIEKSNTGGIKWDEMKWGQTLFDGWKSFIDFLNGKFHPTPIHGKLTYTPPPKITNGELPILAPPMKFSGYDYEGWAKGSIHPPNATIKLIPEDDMMLKNLKWEAVSAENNVYYYINSKNGDKAYFFVDGHATIVPKDKPQITLSTVKMALEMIYHSMIGPTPPPESIGIGASASAYNTKKKKKKKVLAGTENMPWSGVDYVSMWKAYSPSSKGLMLNTQDEEILKNMGWVLSPFPDGYSGHCYKHGNEALAFYSTGKTMYWSNSGKPPTQSWTSPEDAVRWLWKNGGSVENKNAAGEMPWSNTDYKSIHQMQTKTFGNFAISLIPQDENVLKKIGFKKEIINSEKNPAFKIQYHTTTGKDVEVLYFFADGQATYWVNGLGPKYYTIESLMKLMWDKHGPHI